jgi:hypothetical protein
MDRAMKERHLALAERHVAQGERHIAQQRQLIAQIEQRGIDSKLARDLLQQFEEMQALHTADRDRLRQELEQ